MKYQLFALNSDLYYEFTGEVKYSGNYYTILVKEGFMYKADKKIPIDGRFINNLEIRSHVLLSDVPVPVSTHEGGLFNFNDVITFYLYKFYESNTLMFQVVHQIPEKTNKTLQTSMPLFKRSGLYEVRSSAHPDINLPKNAIFIGGTDKEKTNNPVIVRFQTTKELDVCFDKMVASLKAMAEEPVDEIVVKKEATTPSL